ncbi:MAG: DUF2062 domain-containing protein [Gammaproteobacteria bacterium]
MARKLFKRYGPDPHRIRNHKHLQFFGKLLHSPNLWHLNRRSVSRAVALGLFMAFVPIPFQTVPAAALAIMFQFNLPITVALVWITNPLTMAPIFYFVYKLGSVMLGRPPHPLLFQPTWDWLMNELHWIWQPFLLGSFTIATASALAGFLLVQGFWRLHVMHDWHKRKRLRQARAES